MQVFTILVTTCVSLFLLSNKADLHLQMACGHRAEKMSFWLVLFPFTRRGTVSGNCAWFVVIWGLYLPRPLWSHLHTVALALCLANAVTYLCCQASGSLVIFISARAFWPLCEQKSFVNSYGFESTGCADSGTTAGEVFTSCTFSCHAECEIYSSSTSAHMCLQRHLLAQFTQQRVLVRTFSLRYSFGLFSNRSHRSSAVGWFLLELLSWKQGVLYHERQMHFPPISGKILVAFMEQHPKRLSSRFSICSRFTHICSLLLCAEHLLKDFSCSLMGIFYYLTLGSVEITSFFFLS